MGVTIDDARAIVAPLPRSYEALVRDQVKFRVGQIVYAAFSRDETTTGFGLSRLRTIRHASRLLRNPAKRFGRCQWLAVAGDRNSLFAGGGASSMRNGRPAATHTLGRSMTCMCRCGSVELPEFPHSPMTSPAVTWSPGATVTDRCRR